MRLIVTNPTGRRVARGGLLFAPRSTREVVVGNIPYREIKACRRLRIVKASTDDKTPLAVDPTPAPPVEAPAIAIPEPPPAEMPAAAIEEPAPPAPVEYLPAPPAHPETASDDEKPAAAPAAQKKKREHPCPECGQVCKSAIGLLSHRRRHHAWDGN